MCIQWTRVLITLLYQTRQSNPPISQFNSQCNEFTSFWSKFVYNSISTLVSKQKNKNRTVGAFDLKTYNLRNFSILRPEINAVIGQFKHCDPLLSSKSHHLWQKQMRCSSRSLLPLEI